jgi:hypothetical protein
MNDRKPQNINWNTERELPYLDNYRDESYISDDNHVVRFDYNGYRVEAQLAYKINIKTDREEGGERDEILVNVVATDFELDLITMFYNDGEDYKVPVKEFKTIENELLTDLQIQY